ncbi:MAG: hypothetical protein L0Y58_22505 [Verrucomicrobia subdivision 3 bacterium]|nr:hypothetical protein [Limisphaerales bacterium]
MNETDQSIFRPEALRRYVRSQEESVLPRLVSPRTFVTLWLVFGILVAGGILVWLSTIRLLTHE